MAAGAATSSTEWAICAALRAGLRQVDTGLSDVHAPPAQAIESLGRKRPAVSRWLGPGAGSARAVCRVPPTHAGCARTSHIDGAIYVAIVGVILFTVLVAGGTARLLRPEGMDPPWKHVQEGHRYWEENPEAWKDWHRRQMLVLAVLFASLAAGSYPLARRITRRLEGVQQGLRAWGDGDLSTRVTVEGHDEIADVATTFNQAADRVEALVESERRLLASASHELRSPMARLRVAVELLREGHGEASSVLADAAGDITELDGLIEDLLLAGRLEAQTAQQGFEDLDLLGLVAEEAARAGVEVDGSPTVIRGHARMWRRLVRNLLDNAIRYGREDVAARVRPGELVVEDRGPGVRAGDEERIFEPFYRPGDHREGADGGVGLGLHLARQIAEHHDAALSYRPRPGGGSRFEVRWSVDE